MESSLGYSLANFVRELAPFFGSLLWAHLSALFRSVGGVTAHLLSVLAMDYCTEYRIVSNIKTRAFITRDDYSSAHIIRTDLLHRYGTRNIGLMHSALVPLKYFAALTNIHCHAYLIGADGYRRLYAPHWNSDHVRAVGHWRPDMARASASNPAVKERFTKKYGSGFHILALVQGYNPVFRILLLYLS